MTNPLYAMWLTLLRKRRTSSGSAISNHRLPKDLHRRVRMLGVHVSRYRPDGVVIVVVVVIVVNAVVKLAAPQPGFRLRLHFPRCFCSQERQYPSKRQLLSCIVVNKETQLTSRSEVFKMLLDRSSISRVNRNNFHVLWECKSVYWQISLYCRREEQ